MKKNLKREIKSAINNSLKDVLNEAYVTEPKRYDLRTEFLSGATKKILYTEFETFVASLNQSLLSNFHDSIQLLLV